MLAQIVAPKLFSQAAVNTAETTAETRSSDTLYDKSKTGSVTASVLNVRKGPSTSTNVVSTLKNGTKVTLLGENGNFYKIKNGYISKDYVLLAKSGDSFYTTAKTGVIVNSTVLNIREGASTSTDILGTIKKGTTVKLYGTNGKFYRSDKGYLSKTYVVIKSSGDSIYSTSKTGTVTLTSDTLNIRQSASTSSKVVGSLANGAKVKLLGSNGNFYKISSGYISKDYVYVGSVTNYSSSKLAFVTADGARLNVRRSPSSTATVVSYLSDRTCFKVTGESGSFYKFSGGYVMKKYVHICNATVKNSVKITSGTLNIRSGPGTNYSVVGSYKNGQSLTFTDATSKWYKTSKGWVSATYVSTKTATLANAANVRQSASTSSKTVTTLKKGTKVKVLAVNSKGWFLTDKGGWIKGANLK